MHEAGTQATVILATLILLQLAIASVVLAMDLVGGCGSCGAGDRLHALVAGTGVLGYLVLLAILRARAWTAVFAGVFGALGIHLALGALMIARGAFCPLCALAACLSLGAPAALLLQDSQAVRWIPRASVPAFLFAGLASWILFGVQDARAESQRADARAAAQLLQVEMNAPDEKLPHPRTELHVFESDHCPYCREFRDAYAPRLMADFPRLEIVYHPAAGVPWVRRTPTLLLGGELAFEGLPVNYEDLRNAVSLAHRLALAQAPGR